MTLGPRSVEGAINAAVGFVFFQDVVLPTWIPFLVNHIQPLYHMGALPVGLEPILFGLGALTYAKHPEGILEFQKRRSYERMQDSSTGSDAVDAPTPMRPACRIRRAARSSPHRRAARRMSLLQASDVSKRFAGITALNEVSLDVGEGEIVGLIGPNGAGKTTFFNCLLGLLRPDSGSVTFDGRDLGGVPTHRRARLGIGARSSASSCSPA